MKARTVLVLLGLSSPAGASTSVEAQVAQIRQNYAAVNQSVQNGTYRRQVKEFPYCPGIMGQERTLWTDPSGTPRLYVERGGSDDSAATVSHYLDRRGKVNFVFVEWNSVWNGVNYRLRLYYDPNGQVIQRLEEGQQWFDPANIRRDVVKAFQATYPAACSRP